MQAEQKDRAYPIKVLVELFARFRRGRHERDKGRFDLALEERIPIDAGKEDLCLDRLCAVSAERAQKKKYKSVRTLSHNVRKKLKKKQNKINTKTGEEWEVGL